jgi:hypothetical protein
MNRMLLLVPCLCGLLVPGSRLDAQTRPPETAGGDNAASAASLEGVAQEPEQKKKPSPWLLMPLVSTSPKMATSFGALGAYLHHFDEKSQVSMFGAMFQYSTTDSKVGGLFARTSFGADHQRLEAFAGFGYVNNEYKDFAGTGQTLRTTDDIRMVAARYLYRVKGNWFVGAQGASGNYTVSGASAMDDQILTLLGITGFGAGGLGVALMHDSRDNQDMPAKGWYSNLNNLANREWLGADGDYDSYRLETKWFREHGKGHVFAVRQNNQFTVNAPQSAEATVELRGYKLGQYYGKHMSSIEGEERIHLSKRFGATLFAGVGWLYGSGDALVSSDGAYPTYGAGLQFILKPEDHMLLNFEFGHGNLNNYGLYLKFGYSW